MRTRQRILAAAMAVAFAAHARATEYTWTPTAAGTAYDWNVAGNWGGAGYPNAAGDVAGLTNNLVGNQTVRLRQNLTVGQVYLGDKVPAVGQTTIANSGTETFTMTFDSGAVGVPAGITLSAVTNYTHYVNVPVVLAGGLKVDLTGVDSANAQRISFGGLVNLGTNNMTFVNGIYGQGQVTFAAASEFTGTGTIINNSSSVIGVDGKKSFGGKMIANGRANGSNATTFTFNAGGFTNAVEIIVNGYVVGSEVRMGGGVQVGNNSSATQNPGQRLTQRKMTLNGAHITEFGTPATTGTLNDWQKGLEWVRESVATVDLHSGYNYLSIGRGGNTQGTVVEVGTLQRGRGASLYFFRGTSIFDRLLLAGNGATFLSGAGGATNTTTMSIVPWMGVYQDGGFVNPAGFATYDAVLGFRQLITTTEYAASITAGAAHNVNVNNVTLASDASINSLRFTGGSSNMGAARKLTIGSGGIFFTGGGTIGASGNAAAGTVDFGTAEGIVSAHANNSATIGAVVTGTGGLSKIQTGTLTLTGANTLSGPVHVGGGTLRVGDGTYGSNVGSGDVTVHAGAVLRISTATAIADAATVTLYNLGPDMYFGKVEIDAGRNETVKLLYLGEQGMPAGTYGSTSSSAGTKDDRYFAGSGVLTVTSNAMASNSTTLITVR